MLNQVDERRSPRTEATVNDLLDRWLEVVDIDRKTRAGYVSKIEKHVRPTIGRVAVGRVRADTLEGLYADLRRCRDHCGRRTFVQHRTDGEHVCDEHSARRQCAKTAGGDEAHCKWCKRACATHRCRPLAAGSILVVHAILSGAFARAVRWGWVAVSPIDQTAPPARPRPNADPPSAADAAAILNEAWNSDLDWGTLIWLLMTTGSRRGEVCGLRWPCLDVESGLAIFRRSTGQIGRDIWEKDIKTHQDRRVTLDPEIVEVLREYRARCDERAAELGTSVRRDGYVFSSTQTAPYPSSRTPLPSDTAISPAGSGSTLTLTACATTPRRS